MNWSEADLNKIKKKGFTTVEQERNQVQENGIPAPKKKKIEKVSVEKNTIDFIFLELKQNGIVKSYVTELIFDEVRKFRFDWAIPEYKIAVEYEGIFSTKSRHTTIAGFSEDCTKYNLALMNGWKVLRYTAMNFQNVREDIIKLISIK